MEGSGKTVAAEVEKRDAALGAGVDALRNHVVHEAGLAAGGDEDLAAAIYGLFNGRRGRRWRGCAGEGGGVLGSLDAILVVFVVATAADAGAAVLVGVFIVIVIVVAVVVAARGV